MNNFLSCLPTPEYEKKPGRPTVIVRLRTVWWHDHNGLYQRKSLTILKRKSQGHNYLLEEASAVGAGETFVRIVNLDKSEDGVYLVETCNQNRDYETGIVDDYDFKLVPYIENDYTKGTQE